MYKTLASIVMMLWSSLLFSQNTRTKLATPAAWSNAAGWAPNGIPVSGEKVIIPAGVTVTINTELSYSSLFIDVFGSIVLANNRSLSLGSPASYINLQATGSIEALQTSNNNSQITINGLTQFVSNQTYSINGGDKGLIKGPALATGAGSGFSFGIVLPVTFSSIELRNYVGATAIYWETSLDNYKKYFEVERSIDGRAWSVISTISINSSVLNRYQYIDKHPAEGINYYRICAVEDNGSRTLSGILKSEPEPASGKIQLIPNPAATIVKIDFATCTASSSYRYQLYTNAGILVQQGSFASSIRSAELNVSRIPNGNYQVILIAATGSRYTTSLLVQH
jgi:hypothetical protein